MDRKEANMIGFEIVAHAGDARSNLLEAIEAAEKGDFEKAEALVAEADESINDAHNTQTSMLSQEAAGDEIEVGFIMVHGQDHLMTTLLLRDIVKHLIKLYKKG
ncbi:MAG: PTS lactose/cellobiose transporter subunit IIA [Staphylococcus equorum]|uniref:PTS lactose/cellobiose transporter subunit IIA n=1 Tax=Tissierella sp. TaxID=41274 RepID=UPI000ED11490|nr:PTS lactose/cellobiose transporter subunit IIA [Alkalibacterium sp.]MDN6294084.1 PTS lactose/cellobiose transporter subunit IIA [Alkalibacterium sp.]MDN6317424.1 PTS lactose/cellobiose transporter subunit IIA [Lactococcus lactis]MDN6742374.1 PTS lactose/cellobiose transporter subunit IIA [Staphylococcus equorum]HAJ70341.1 PTS lactose transporter subunit IIA [Alkalibacterium sp.]